MICCVSLPEDCRNCACVRCEGTHFHWTVHLSDHFLSHYSQSAHAYFSGSSTHTMFSGSQSPVASGSTSSFIHLGQSSSLPGISNTLPSQKRARGSIILANLPFNRTKGKKTIRPHTAPRPQSYLYPEVIEISASTSSRKEDEDAERERLRDAAAQSIGLDPVLLEEQAEHSVLADTEESGAASSDAHTPTPVSTPIPTPVFPGFPATPASLQPFKQLSARFAKYYHPPSLLMFALTRQWKPRELILTTSPESISHLHVFKSAAANERELERLEISADSVVFVAEEEVAGKRGVVKVGGINGAEMTLHSADSSEAQNWIAAIKHAVLSQRFVSCCQYTTFPLRLHWQIHSRRPGSIASRSERGCRAPWGFGRHAINACPGHAVFSISSQLPDARARPWSFWLGIIPAIERSATQPVNNCISDPWLVLRIFIAPTLTLRCIIDRFYT